MSAVRSWHSTEAQPTDRIPYLASCSIAMLRTITSVEAYTQGCDVLGIGILAGEDVDPVAVEKMSDRTFNMLVARSDLLGALVDAGISSRIAEQDQRLPSLPEFGNVYEYWAEGLQSYFGLNLEEPDDRPPNSAHNRVDTREGLDAHDPSLYEIARSVFGANPWRPRRSSLSSPCIVRPSLCRPP